MDNCSCIMTLHVMKEHCAELGSAQCSCTVLVDIIYELLYVVYVHALWPQQFNYLYPHIVFLQLLIRGEK